MTRIITNSPIAFSQGRYPEFQPMEWIDTREAGRRLHMTDWSVRAKISAGELRASRVGKRLLIAASDVEVFIRSRTVAPKPAKVGK